jgi:hypothetical protein
LTLDIAGLIQALAERVRHRGIPARRPAAKEANHRHRRLLCTRNERPHRHRAAEQRDELAALQLIELHSIPASQGRIAGYRIGEDQC